MRKFYIKRSLNANAFRASDVRSKFVDKLPTVHEHIIKLVLMPTAQPVNHWKSEIATALNNISKMKGKGYPKANMLFQWSYTDYEDELDNLGKLKRICNQIRYEYSDLQMIDIEINTLQQKVKTIMHDYLEWLCQLLPVDGYVEARLCAEKLTELLAKEG